jgi:hypothetical protein
VIHTVPHCHLPALVLALAAAGAVAAPVDASTHGLGPDPYEVATRWTLASVNSDPVSLPAVVVAPALPRFSPLPHLSGSDNGVPDPGAYALMGAVLLGAGLLARRGLAKKR